MSFFFAKKENYGRWNIFIHVEMNHEKRYITNDLGSRGWPRECIRIDEEFERTIVSARCTREASSCA